MSSVTRTAGIAGSFTYSLTTTPFSAPVMRIYSDAARTTLVHGPLTLTGSAKQWTATYPATLAVGTYYLKFSTVIASGEPALDDVDDTLVLVSVVGSVDGVDDLSPLATVDELATWLQRDLDGDDASANLALELASAAVRGEAHQTFTRIDDHEVVLRGNWSSDLWLPERPVIAVGDIAIANGDGLVGSQALASTAYQWDVGGLMRRYSGWWGGPGAAVTVTYTHGWETIPGEVKAIALQLAANVYESTGASLVMDRDSGVEDVRDATERGNVAVLTKASARVLRRYRPRLP